MLTHREQWQEQVIAQEKPLPFFNIIRAKNERSTKHRRIT